MPILLMQTQQNTTEDGGYTQHHYSQQGSQGLSIFVGERIHGGFSVT